MGAPGPVGGGRQRGSQVTETLCPRAAQSSGGRREGRCVRGDSFRVRGVDVLPHLEAGVRWGSQVGSRFCSRGPRLWLPGSGALGSPAPTPSSFRNSGLPSSCSRPTPHRSRTRLPCAPLLTTRHSSSASPSPPPKKTPVLSNSDP